MSDEIAQDDEGGFEIASIGGSELDEDEEREGRDKDIERGIPASSVGGGLGGSSAGPSGGAGATVTPGANNTRKQSIDEPIFEVGEGEGWSDGEVMSDSDDGKKGERKGLTGKKD